MAGRDDETRMVPPEPDATQLVQSGSDAPTILNTPETMIAGGSQGSSVSRPISASLASSRAAATTPGAKRIGDYEIESEIARGGMGVVYKARQLSLNRPVAFKMILAGQFASAADVERFHVEAEAAAGLDHPNIVPIYEVGAFEGNHFFTMKFVDGTSMSHEMSRLVKAPRDGVRLLVKVCRAIHYAHQHSILHRDLKPANILLDGQGEPHVTDFGLAKRTGADSQLTQTGMIVGTPSYMAPEQAAPSKVLTTSADVYSLGAILYEILTGRPPFRGNSPLDTVMLVLNKEADRPRSINASADRDLETVALKCLEKDPARRYGSAEALAEDLDRWLNQEPILARPIGTPERVIKWAKRRPAIAAMAAAVAIATVAGVAGVIWQWREAVYQRGLAAEALISLAAEAQQKELARSKEAAQRSAAEAAQAQEVVARKAADEQRGIAVGALDSLERFQYLNSVTLADHEWAANNIGHVDQLLAAGPAPLRNWEWHYLGRLAHMETDALPAPGGRILAFAVSPDGTRATTVTADLNASLWDLRTRKMLRKVKLDGTPGMEFGQTALSANGAIFMGSIHRLTNGKLSEDDVVWDTTTGESLWTLSQNPVSTFGNYTAVALNVDGTRLVAASTELNLSAGAASAAGLTPAQMQAAAARALDRSDTRLRVWNARTGASLPSAGVVTGRTSTMSLSPDGQLAIVGSGSGSAAPVDSRILDVATGKVVATLTHSAGSAGAFSADGRLIVASVPNGIRVWPASGGEERWSWTGKSVGMPAFSASGRLVVTALADRSIQVLDSATGRDVTRFTGNTAAVRTVAFAGTDSDIVSVDSGSLRLFKMNDTTPIRVGEGTADNVQAVGVTLDHRLVVAAGLNGGLKAWDIETGRLLFNSTSATAAGVASPLAMMSQASPINTRVLFSGDGRRTPRVSSAMVDAGGGRVEMQSSLRFYDTRSGQEVWQAGTGGGGRELTPPEFAKALQSGTSMGMAMALALDDTGAHAALVTMKMAINLGSGTGGPAGGSAILGSEISLWKAPVAAAVAVINLPNTMAVSAELSPDGRRLVVLAGAYTNQGPVAADYRVYDATNGRLLMAFPGAKESAPIAFSRDGALLAAETARNTVTIWDLGHAGRATELAEHSSAVTRLAFSPDGTRLATLSTQGITLFDVRSGNQLLVLRESNGPFSVREFIAPGKVSGGGTTLAFSADGRQILQTLVANDPKGIKVTFKVWDGSPVTK